ncbi:MAG: DNA translocase FtsK 4TM domain-containing protein, partial [Polyangiales bacterium]
MQQRSDGSQATAPPSPHPVWVVVAAALTLTLTLAWGSSALEHDPNLVGPVGAAMAHWAERAWGVAAWVLPWEAAAWTWRLLRGKRCPLGGATIASTAVLLVSLSALAHLLATDADLAAQSHHAGTQVSPVLAGGLFGEAVGEVLRAVVGRVGAIIALVTAIWVTWLLRAPESLAASAHGLWQGLRWSAQGSLWALRRLLQAGSRMLDSDVPLSATGTPAPAQAIPVAANLDADTHSDTGEDGVPAPELTRRTTEAQAPQASAPQPRITVQRHLQAKSTVPATEDSITAPQSSLHLAPEASSPHRIQDAVAHSPSPRRTADVAAASPCRAADRAVATPSVALAKPPPPASNFALPPLTLLSAPRHTGIEFDPDTLRRNAARLCDKLRAYGVHGRVDEIHPGPVITLYEFEPESGTKVAKIAGLADDLAMALAAQRVRIVAPIPGKARVGFELPNAVRQTVHLREILDSKRWQSTQAALPVALGKDIAGNVVCADLAKMPHLLVAGATGAGKSVGLNVMLCSLLAKKTPAEVRMLMIDPKVVELAVFDAIPHMLLPVVTDMQKAALALRWAVDEMERRYQLFAAAGARSLTSYNERVTRVRQGALPPAAFFRKVKDDESPPAIEPLAHIVVVVDEFADLMMVAAKEVEASVARLAQKARAAGIHVILATQRPSVDVITGMIKANFPTRMAFKVSQREDSKTILGRNGAEQLLGMGDMLYLPPGSADLRRVHCAF